ncbi:putative ATP-binding membrane protein [Serinicoccus hydrothermalis]|uniref:Putative ATP-binding membrane protein n=1 Tax=Serinicoccus hydrothermalis TaxID=1758689 RepID=A0A1B1NAT4_9MICO|nr:YfjP family GTPase [Serinicoccus hydrothermalis]ANS78548.1 putative ATP-binding membrane protein [Serinicoccus hydrothermalis]
MRRGKGSTTQSVVERSERLSTALEVGGPELEPESSDAARQVLGRVGERWAIAGGRTVVALAGATGSGKSSLFNALTGEDVSTISPRRPTTAEAGAAVWGEEDASELLDWLGVANRHHVTMTQDNAGLDGLVLVDLPDFDSRELRHRVEADRILERADVFVWVADPQKYADARLHDDYLRPLRHHDAVMLVVLNQVDRIRGDGEVEQVAADLRRLVEADGAGRHEIVLTSARTQRGIPDLRDRIGEVVGARNAAEARLVADLRSSAERVHERGVAGQTPELGQEADRRLHHALTVASGVPVVLDAVDRDYRRRAVARTGWPFTRWVAGLRPDPLRRLRLGDDSPGRAGIAPSDVRAVLGRSSLPSPTPAARANVQLATRQLGENVGGALPQRWADAVLEAASPQEDTLSDALDQAVVGVPLRTRTPFWWSLLGVLQLLLAATAVVGLLWLVLLMVLGWLQLPVDAPFWGPVPIPLALLAGGVLAGLLVALVGRVAGGVGAARRRRQVAHVLDDAIDEVSYRHVRKPVMTVLDRHEKTRALLEQAAA